MPEEGKTKREASISPHDPGPAEDSWGEKDLKTKSKDDSLINME